MRRFNYLFLAAPVVLVLVVGTLVMAAHTPATGAPGSAAAGPGTGSLDGMSFVGSVGLEGGPADVDDTLIFDNGMLVSTECNARCGYPASPYYVRQVGAAMEFVSESRCLYKDATIVWRGRIEDGVLRGESTWEVNRAYWTVEKRFWFEGKLASEAPREPVGG